MFHGAATEVSTFLPVYFYKRKGGHLSEQQNEDIYDLYYLYVL